MRKLHIAILILVAVHALVLFAGFFAPCNPTEQHRDLPYVSPMRLHLIDAEGHVHLHPFVYLPLAVDGDGFQYREDISKPYPIRFFAHNATGRHLLGVDEPGYLFLMGTDGYGRDLFSRVLFGGRISLAAAFLAMVLSLSIGALLGGTAGHFGKFTDAAIMRAAELMLAVPWLCLLLTIRAFLPLHISPAATLFLVSGVIGTVNWARPARLVRGAVLSAKERGFVTSARGFGASEWYLLRRHVLPQTFGLLITQAVILLPKFVLAETVLSFLGLGIEESLPSWGNMLAALQQFGVMASYWWMAAPIFGLVTVSFTYFLLANVLEQENIQQISGEAYA